MKKINKKIIITALSLVLLLTASVGLTAAYFTDYEAAKGGAVLSLSGQTQLEETMNGNNKTVVIKNVGETDMIVRVQVIGDGDKVNVTAGSEWEKAGDWWYYKDILKAGQETEPLFTQIVLSDKDNINPRYWTDFNVYIRHESKQAEFHESSVEAFEPAH